MCLIMHKSPGSRPNTNHGWQGCCHWQWSSVISPLSFSSVTSSTGSSDITFALAKGEREGKERKESWKEGWMDQMFLVKGKFTENPQKSIWQSEKKFRKINIPPLISQNFFIYWHNQHSWNTWDIQRTQKADISNPVSWEAYHPVVRFTELLALTLWKKSPHISNMCSQLGMKGQKFILQESTYSCYQANQLFHLPAITSTSRIPSLLLETTRLGK